MERDSKVLLGRMFSRASFCFAKAHCKDKAFDGAVYVGSIYKRHPNKGEQRKIVGLLYAHPRFVPTHSKIAPLTHVTVTAQWDLAMFRIQPVTKSHLKPIPLERASVLKGEVVSVTGIASQAARWVEMKVVGFAHCRKVSRNKNIELHEPSQFCIDSIESSIDTGVEPGDSGGPVVNADGNLVGVISGVSQVHFHSFLNQDET